jgi:hypothetical protein
MCSVFVRDWSANSSRNISALREGVKKANKHQEIGPKAVKCLMLEGNSIADSTEGPLLKEPNALS